MNGFASLVLVMLVLSTVPRASRQGVIECVRADQDVPLTLDPAVPFWRDARVLVLEKDKFGKKIPHLRAMVRTRWTKKNVYFLFVSPYDELNLRPRPTTVQETNELWNWDVAEVFI